MIYGYIRVSTDKQTVENQRFEINRFCERENIIVERWLEETVSGNKEPEKRKLGRLLKDLKKGIFSSAPSSPALDAVSS